MGVNAAVSPMRAMLTAHIQLTWNRARKEMGQHGVWLFGFLVVVIALSIALPLGGGGVLLGFVMGKRLANPDVALGLGAILMALSVGLGILAGIFGGRQGLDIESHRCFPLRPYALLAVELLSSLADPWVLALGLLQAALMVGVLIVQPMLAPVLFLAWAGLLLTTLLTHHLVQVLAGFFLKRIKYLILAILIGAWFGIFGLNPGNQDSPPVVIEKALPFLKAFFAWTPWGSAVLGWRQMLSGAWLTGILLQLYPWAFVAVMYGAALWSQSLELKAPKKAAASGKRERLWSFGPPVHGIARLHFNTIMGSTLGRYSYLVPLIAILAPLMWPDLQKLGPWILPVASIYVVYCGLQFHFNQFGLDAQGVKALLLLPMEGQSLFLGKGYALMLHMAIQIALLMVGGIFFMKVSLSVAFASLALAFAYFLMQVGVGHFMSVLYPRATPRKGIKNKPLPLPATLFSLALVGIGNTLLGLPYFLLARFAPSFLFPGMLLMAVLCFVLYRWVLLPMAGMFLDERRENLMAHLG